jgi:hypothetical protein
VLNDLQNIQGLPQSMNASKRASLNWQTYKGQPLNAAYQPELMKRQQALKAALQDLIKQLLGP